MSRRSAKSKSKTKVQLGNVEQGSTQTGTEKGLVGLPLPSTNPATNHMIADIVLRGAGGILRQSLEKRMLVASYTPEKARQVLESDTILTSIALYGASRLATRSPAGLALVAGGLVLKALYDRGKTRQLQRRRARRNNAPSQSSSGTGS